MWRGARQGASTFNGSSFVYAGTVLDSVFFHCWPSWLKNWPDTAASDTPFAAPTMAAEIDFPKLKQKALAEFLAMLLFVFIGAGSACGVAGSPGWVNQVALTFGFAITCLAYTIGHISGGHINCAVTLGLTVAKLCPPVEAGVIFVAQMLGSTCGAALLAILHDSTSDATGGLGTNSLGPNISAGQAVCGEVLMTFLLMYVVLETACNPKSAANGVNAPIAIGFAVFLAHSVLIPIDGCSINPTRSFGPAVVMTGRGSAGQWNDHWIFWLGPCLGSVLAVGAFKLINPEWSPPGPEPEPEPEPEPVKIVVPEPEPAPKAPEPQELATSPAEEATLCGLST